jgi:hypothetical protein
MCVLIEGVIAPQDPVSNVGPDAAAAVTVDTTEDARWKVRPRPRRTTRPNDGDRLSPVEGGDRVAYRGTERFRHASGAGEWRASHRPWPYHRDQTTTFERKRNLPQFTEPPHVSLIQSSKALAYGLCASLETTMPFARIDLAQGKSPEYRATVGDVVYDGIVNILKAPDGDRFQVIGEHAPENFVYDPNFLNIKRSTDLIYIQVTSTVGNTKEQKLAFFRHMADQLNGRLGVRREDVFVSLVFVDREDWSFGNGEPW